MEDISQKFLVIFGKCPNFAPFFSHIILTSVYTLIRGDI